MTTHLYSTTNYITLDDPMQLSLAHNAPELFRYLKMYADRLKKPGQYLLAGSQQLRMRPLLARIEQSLPQDKPSSSARAAYPSGLTNREVEVLGLVA